MSACKTGCGRESRFEQWFCGECWDAWEASAERKRFYAQGPEAASDIAMTDFCTRIRAERLNGGRNDQG
jgi:hypothetical protein